jgi:hypothetical protein
LTEVEHDPTPDPGRTARRTEPRLPRHGGTAAAAEGFTEANTTTPPDPQEFDISNEQVPWLLTGLRLLEDAYLAGREAPLHGLLTDGGRHPKPSVADIHDLYQRLAGR